LRCTRPRRQQRTNRCLHTVITNPRPGPGRTVVPMCAAMWFVISSRRRSYFAAVPPSRAPSNGTTDWERNESGTNAPCRVPNATAAAASASFSVPTLRPCTRRAVCKFKNLGAFNCRRLLLPTSIRSILLDSNLREEEERVKRVALQLQLRRRRTAAAEPESRAGAHGAVHGGQQARQRTSEMQ
jgi:hypothetical protein